MHAGMCGCEDTRRQDADRGGRGSAPRRKVDEAFIEEDFAAHLIRSRRLRKRRCWGHLYAGFCLPGDDGSCERMPRDEPQRQRFFTSLLELTTSIARAVALFGLGILFVRSDMSAAILPAI